MNAEKLISGQEVAKHNSRESCWIIVHGKVYDVTEFLDEHPGEFNVLRHFPILLSRIL